MKTFWHVLQSLLRKNKFYMKPCLNLSWKSRKHCGRRTCWLPLFFSFPAMFSDVLILREFKFTKVCYRINAIPNKKNLKQSRLKTFAHDNIKITQKLKFVLGRVEKLWEKEKMLVTSIFSFSHNVFKSLLLQGCENLG